MKLVRVTGATALVLALTPIAPPSGQVATACSPCQTFYEEDTVIHAFNETSFFSNQGDPHEEWLDGACDQEHPQCLGEGLTTEMLDDLVGALDGETNDYLTAIEQFPQIAYNANHKVVQVLNCSGGIALQVPVPAELTYAISKLPNVEVLGEAPLVFAD